MKLLSKEITTISEEDLQELCDEKFGEARIIEYKAQLNFGTNEEREKVLSQIASFANAGGGHLIYGIKTNPANKSEPVEVAGQPITDADGLVLQIEQVARQRLLPRIPFFETQPVRLKDGNYAIVFRIPQSWNRPHQLVFNNKYQFYGRSSNGRIQIDVEELRNLFIKSAEVGQRLEMFRASRIAAIASQSTPAGHLEPPFLVWHAVALPDYIDGTAHPLDQRINHIRELMPFDLHVSSCYYNFEGALNKSSSDRALGYTQIYRDLKIEMVRGDLVSGEYKEKKHLPFVDISARFLKALIVILGFYRKTNAQLPLLLMPSLIGIKDFTLMVPNSFSGRDSLPVQEEVLQLPAIYVEDFETSPTSLIKSSFDILWQTAGVARCWFYDEDGNWDEKKGGQWVSM